MNRYAIYLILALCALAARASVAVPYTHPGPLAPDSSNFVTASLVVISPGQDVYSSLGHCALRMECSVHDLDYCFSLETDVRMADFIKFFSGSANAAFAAVPTDVFVGYYRENGRGAMQYELNLTLHEKQELWRMLDNDMVAGAHRKFNFAENNCTSTSLIILEQSILPARIEFKWPEKMLELNNGDGVRYLYRNTPWTRFICLSLIGTEADVFWPQESRMSPEMYPAVVSNSRIIDDEGQVRPMLKRKSELLPIKLQARQSVNSPFTFFPLGGHLA